MTIKRLTIIICLFFLSATSIAQFRPDSLTSLKLWLSSDTGLTLQDNQKVNVWHDRSNNGNFASQTDTALMPRIINSNFIQFGKNGKGYTQLKLNETINLEQGKFCIYLVYRTYSTTNGVDYILSGDSANIFKGGVFSGGNLSNGFGLANNNFLRVSPNPMNRFGIYTFSANRILLNGIEQSYVNNDFVDKFRINSIGTRSDITSFYFNGELTEILIFNDSLTVSLRNKVFNYLNTKYASPVHLGPDTLISTNTLCPITLKSKHFFSNYRWSTGENSNIIQVTDPGKYWLTCQDIFGTRTTDTIVLRRQSFPKRMRDTLFCFSTAGYRLDLGITEGTYDTQWSFKSGTSWIETSTTTSFVASQIGKYRVRLVDNLNCSILDSFDLSEDLFSTRRLVSDTVLCSGNAFKVHTFGNNIRDYLWNGTSTVPLFVAGNSGVYTLRTTNNNGCLNTTTFNATITGIAPTIQFAVSGGVDTVCSNAVVTFLNNSSLPSGVNAAAYRWNFGNGITNSSLWTPLTTTYTTAGNVLVTLSVAGDNGCSNIGQRQITVLNLPSANFTIASPKLCQNDSIQLVSNSLPNSSVPLNSFTWRSGIATLSGITLASAVPVKFRYSTFGTFTATLAVANRYGCANSFQRSFSVLPSPLVNFTNTTACLGATTSFADSTIFAGGTSALSRVWDFGNGNTETISTPNNTYTSAGTYPVKLTVTNNATCTAQFTKNVRVNPLPAARVQIPLACVQTPLTFLDLSTVAGDSIVQRRWQVGNVFTSTIPNPSFTFPDSGTYSVMLTVSTRSCTNSLSRPENLVVRPKPISNFTLSPTFGAPPLTVTLTSSVTGFSHLWRWNTQFSTLSSGFTATFTDTGSVSIWHRVTNTFGCVDSTLKILKVAPPRIDYAVEGLILGTSAGFQQVTVVVSNKGNVALPSFVIEITSKDGFTLREKVNMEIQPGQVVSVALNALWPINASKNPYTCATVLLENYTDQVPTNNERCVFTEGSYTIGNPYPNPTSNDNIYLNITSKTAESVSIQWIDIHGKTWGESSFDIPEGQTSTFEIPVYNLFSGTYIVLVRFQNTVFTRKFIKL